MKEKSIQSIQLQLENEMKKCAEKDVAIQVFNQMFLLLSFISVFILS
jgi:hypothetical protein